MKFDSTRSEMIALAKEGCALCLGLGLRRSGNKGPGGPCNCVLRSIFRACYERFRLCVSKEKHMSQARLEQVNGKDYSHSWGMKDEEYIVDFCNVSRRALNEEEYRIFRFHYLLGADWKMCCRRLNMDRGTFFHAVYRLQQKLGGVYRDLKPYALYPVNEYFAPTIRREAKAEGKSDVTPSNVIEFPTGLRMGEAKPQPLRPPLRKVA